MGYVGPGLVSKLGGLSAIAMAIAKKDKVVELLDAVLKGRDQKGRGCSGFLPKRGYSC